MSCFHTARADDLVEGWGRVVDPDGDCGVQVGDNSLTILFGSGPHGLDAETKRMNSPRVLQSLNGNFSVAVTVEGNLQLPQPANPTPSAYISGGLVLMKDDDNYIRLERASFTRGGTIWHYANFEQRVGSRRTRMGRFADFPLQADKPVELRLEVQGDQVRALVRHAGDDWHELGTTKMAHAEALLAGISGVKTARAEADVGFRRLQIAANDPPADARTRSAIKLDLPDRVLAVPIRPKPNLTNLFSRLNELRQRSLRIGEMSPAEEAKLIADAKELVVVKSEDLSARFGPAIAKSLAHRFAAADKPQTAIRVYREFADALEQVNDESVTPVIDGLRRSASQLEQELQLRDGPREQEEPGNP